MVDGRRFRPCCRSYALGLRRKLTFPGCQRRRQLLGAFSVEHHLVFFTIIGHAVFRQSVGVDDLKHLAAKCANVAMRAALFAQQFKPYRPKRLLSAVLARQLVQAALQRFAKPEIVTVNRQHFVRLHCVKKPLRQSDFDGNHAFVVGRLLDDRPTVDDAEILFFTLAARFNVGLDACPGQAIKSGL